MPGLKKSKKTGAKASANPEKLETYVSSKNPTMLALVLGTSFEDSVFNVTKDLAMWDQRMELFDGDGVCAGDLQMEREHQNEEECGESAKVTRVAAFGGPVKQCDIKDGGCTLNGRQDDAFGAVYEDSDMGQYCLSDACKLCQYKMNGEELESDYNESVSDIFDRRAYLRFRCKKNKTNSQPILNSTRIETMAEVYDVSASPAHLRGRRKVMSANALPRCQDELEAAAMATGRRAEELVQRLSAYHVQRRRTMAKNVQRVKKQLRSCKSDGELKTLAVM